MKNIFKRPSLKQYKCRVISKVYEQVCKIKYENQPNMQYVKVFRIPTMIIRIWDLLVIRGRVLAGDQRSDEGHS